MLYLFLSWFTVFFVYFRKQKGRKRTAESTELIFDDELLPVVELLGVSSTQVTILISFSSLQKGYYRILYQSKTSFCTYMTSFSTIPSLQLSSIEIVTESGCAFVPCKTAILKIKLKILILEISFADDRHRFLNRMHFYELHFG